MKKIAILAVAGLALVLAACSAREERAFCSGAQKAWVGINALREENVLKVSDKDYNIAKTAYEAAKVWCAGKGIVI